MAETHSPVLPSYPVPMGPQYCRSSFVAIGPSQLFGPSAHRQPLAGKPLGDGVVWSSELMALSPIHAPSYMSVAVTNSTITRLLSTLKSSAERTCAMLLPAISCGHLLTAATHVTFSRTSAYSVISGHLGGNGGSGGTEGGGGGSAGGDGGDGGDGGGCGGAGGKGGGGLHGGE